MNSKEQFDVFAVRVLQPWEKDKGSDYWIPRIYEELKNGKARFGWSWFDEADLRLLRTKLEKDGWDSFSKDEKESWSHGSFMLSYVRPGDYFVYINMPEYGKCTIVKITGEYGFTGVWDDEGKGDFRHMMPCEFVATFERNSDIVHPYLRRRLSLPGSWWTIYAKEEFIELLEAIESGKKGRKVEERFRKELDKYLRNITAQLHRMFPSKSLEDMLLKILKNLPNVLEVRKGPDTNGADLEIEFQSGLGIGGLQSKELCAVQVKSYEGEMADTRAIRDIERAFKSNPDYSCGLIISTALSVSEEFEKELVDFVRASNKPVGLLLGEDLARLVVRYGFHS